MSCVSSPTLTRTDDVVTDSFSASTTTHVTSLPPTLTTLTLTPSCTATSGPCSAGPTVTVSTIPGGSTTVVEVVTITVPVTSPRVTTLWGSSCTQTTPDRPTNTPTTPTDTFTPPSSTNTLPILSTPPPSIIVTSSSSTLADGEVTPVVMTITSTVAPVLVTPTTPPGSGNSDNSRNLGPIIGGVVGGIAGLGVILFLIWFFIRRRRTWDDIFDRDDDVPAVAAVAAHKEKQQSETIPKPYQYGLVGHTKGPSLTSPPASPPPNIAQPLDGGFDRAHQRNNSTSPLLGLSPHPTVYDTATSVSLRPPSSSSSAPGYGPHVDAQIQGQMWDPNRLYNTTTQPYPAQFFGSPAAAVNAGPPMVGRNNTDDRTGSPVSIQEQRALQVMNADSNPQSPTSPAPTGRPTSSAGRTSLDPHRDGKGRLMTNGEKPPIVHLDGGRFQEGVGSSSAPPAYFE